MAEISAVRAQVHNIGDECVDLVRERAASSAAGAASLAMALGKLCAQLDLDPRQMKDCIDLAYREAQARAAKEA
jgi:hypothetical protein